MVGGGKVGGDGMRAGARGGRGVLGGAALGLVAAPLCRGKGWAGGAALGLRYGLLGLAAPLCVPRPPL